MTDLLLFLIAIALILAIFGIIYPLTALIYYPFYKKKGGKKSFKRYMKSL